MRRSATPTTARRTAARRRVRVARHHRQAERIRLQIAFRVEADAGRHAVVREQPPGFDRIVAGVERRYPVGRGVGRRASGTCSPYRATTVGRARRVGGLAAEEVVHVRGARRDPGARSDRRRRGGSTCTRPRTADRSARRRLDAIGSRRGRERQHRRATTISAASHERSRRRNGRRLMARVTVLCGHGASRPPRRRPRDRRGLPPLLPRRRSPTSGSRTPTTRPASTSPPSSPTSSATWVAVEDGVVVGFLALDERPRRPSLSVARDARVAASEPS